MKLFKTISLLIMFLNIFNCTSTNKYLVSKMDNFFYSNFNKECIKGSCYNGYGTWLNKGIKYVGYFQKGLFNGKGTVIMNNFKLMSNFINGKPNGQLIINKNNSTITGQTKLGKPIGSWLINSNNFKIKYHYKENKVKAIEFISNEFNLNIKKKNNIKKITWLFPNNKRYYLTTENNKIIMPIILFSDKKEYKFSKTKGVLEMFDKNNNLKNIIYCNQLLNDQVCRIINYDYNKIDRMIPNIKY